MAFDGPRALRRQEEPLLGGAPASPVGTKQVPVEGDGPTAWEASGREGAMLLCWDGHLASGAATAWATGCWRLGLTEGTAFTGAVFPESI